MTAATKRPVEGDLVTLVITFGRQTRLKCAVCTRYMAKRARLRCDYCNTCYTPSTISDSFLIESMT